MAKRKKASADLAADIADHWAKMQAYEEAKDAKEASGDYLLDLWGAQKVEGAIQAGDLEAEQMRSYKIVDGATILYSYIRVRPIVETPPPVAPEPAPQPKPKRKP